MRYDLNILAMTRQVYSGQHINRINLIRNQLLVKRDINILLSFVSMQIHLIETNYFFDKNRTALQLDFYDVVFELHLAWGVWEGCVFFELHYSVEYVMDGLFRPTYCNLVVITNAH